MYREMVFVILDIDEFAHWASRFVPKDYHARNAFGKKRSTMSYIYPFLRSIYTHTKSEVTQKTATSEGVKRLVSK